MRIFVYEYAAVQRESALLPASIRNEGRAMLDAVVEDFSLVSGVEVATLKDDSPAAFRELAKAADWSLVIAPELSGILLERCRWVEEAGGRLLGPCSRAVELAGDKWATYQRFREQECPTPWTTISDSLAYAAGFHAMKARPAAAVRKMMTCLTVTPESCAEAVAEKTQLIVSHHPILFRPTQRITTETPEGKMLWALAHNGVAVYSPHTAFDNCVGGINDILCRKLELTDVRPLRLINESAQCKIVVFVPESDLQKVSDALFAAGAGIIGAYGECSFRITGTGTFFGSDAANPAVGQKGRREEVSEYRLEVVCSEGKAAAAVQALRRAHSYEEPAFDVYPLRSLPSKSGAGRIGRLPQPMALQDFCETVRVALNADGIQMIGAAQRTVQQVGVACGGGGQFLKDAVREKADAFLTGEMRFHDQLAAAAEGIAVVLPGHYATERPGVEELAGLLQRQFSELEVWPSRRERDPLVGRAS